MKRALIPTCLTLLCLPFLLTACPDDKSGGAAPEASAPPPPLSTPALSVPPIPSSAPSATAEQAPTATAPQMNAAWADGGPAAPPSGPCDKQGMAKCYSQHWALYCRGTKFDAVPCKGWKGCQLTGGAISCDDSVSTEGDACMPAAGADNFACSSDRKNPATLVCRNGKWAKFSSCRGPRGCGMTGEKSECDSSIAEVNDTCDKDGTTACSGDKKTLVICRGHKMVASNSCLGPKNCTVNATTRKDSCDDSLANAGDPCDTPNETSCTVEGKTKLRCINGKYQKERDCPHRCFKAQDLTCD